LIVEDNPDMRKMLGLILKRLGLYSGLGKSR
jgi:hypothetical protein